MPDNEPLITDDASEIEAMKEFYAREYKEVYFVRDLKANVIVAVEGYPAMPTRPTVSRNGRKCNCLNYRNRLLSSRERYDLAPNGRLMIGYETIFGNDTRLADSERGVVAEMQATPEMAIASEIGVSSPFEEAMAMDRVQSSGPNQDYEFTTLENGLTIERFETFQLERVK